jgi:hypothetical protein
MGAWMIGTRRPSRAVRGVEIARMESLAWSNGDASIRAALGVGKVQGLQFSATD